MELTTQTTFPEITYGKHFLTNKNDYNFYLTNNNLDFENLSLSEIKDL